MNIEKQLTNLELSKQLDNFGVKQESFFTWEVAFGTRSYLIWKDYNKCERGVFDTADVRQYYSAFTVSELLKFFDYKIDLTITKFSDGYKIKTPKKFLIWQRKIDDNLANGLATMLIYLKKNNLLIK